MQLSHQHLFIVALLFSVFLFQLCFFNLAKAAGMQVWKRADPRWKFSASWDVIGPIQTSLKPDIKPLQDKYRQPRWCCKSFSFSGTEQYLLKKKGNLTDLWENIYMSGNCFFIVALHQLEMHRHRLLRGSPEFAFPLYYLRTLWLPVVGTWGAQRRNCKPISDSIAPCRLSLVLQVWESGGSSGCTPQVLSDTLIRPAVDTHYDHFPLRPKATDASLFPFRCSWS